jgi:plasmid stability protein
MPVQITIRHVPEAVRDELARRAALQGKSLQAYLRGHLERMAAKPPMERWIENVRRRKYASGVEVARDAIVEQRELDRR